MPAEGSSGGAAAGQVDNPLICLALLLGHHLIPSDPRQMRHELGASGAVSPGDLVRLAKRMGAKSRLGKLKIKHIPRAPAPFIAVTQSGDYFLVAAAEDARVLIQPPNEAPRVVTLDDLAEVWSGEVVYVTTRASSGAAKGKFDVSWFIPALWRYRHLLRDVLLASFALQL
jgi:ATP-binding cassette, subfamily B, bacterial HlyB/CyaB